MLYGSKIVLCLLLIPKTLYYVDFFNSFLVDFNFIAKLQGLFLSLVLKIVK